MRSRLHQEVVIDVDPNSLGSFESENDSLTAKPVTLSKTQLRWHLRSHVACQLYDDSDSVAEGTAIYTLADPRDLKLIRYVGQTTVPSRRFVQHLNSARPWLPDETPWWVKSARLLPLYGWIRALYRDGYRLPTMVVQEWVGEGARQVERRWIQECLAQQQPLLNLQSKKPAKRSARKAVSS